MSPVELNNLRFVFLEEGFFTRLVIVGSPRSGDVRARQLKSLHSADIRYSLWRIL